MRLPMRVSFQRVGTWSMLLLLAILVRASEGKLAVRSPQELLKAFEDAGRSTSLEYTIANYGHIPYGSSLIGELFFAEPTTGCSPLNMHGSKDEDEPASNHMGPVVVVDRGDCTYITKTRYAELAGASMLIVVNKHLNQNLSTVDMPEHGPGGTITIPTIMITKEDGDILRNHHQAKDVNDEDQKSAARILMTFEMNKNSNNTIDYEVWLSSGDMNSYKFVRNLNPYQSKLGSLARVTPHYVFWYTSTNSNDCLSSGVYCAPDPDGAGPLDGRSVVREDLRQICVFLLSPAIWWDYVAEYGSLCLPFTDEDCHLEVFNRIGLKRSDATKVQVCMTESFDGPDEQQADNKLLAKEKAAFLARRLHYWPAIIINKQQYKGHLDPVQDVFQAMCEALETKPQACFDNTESKPGASFKFLIGTGIIVSLLLVLVLYFYRRMVRREMTREMNLQINQMVSQYFSINDKSEGIEIPGKTNN